MLKLDQYVTDNFPTTTTVYSRSFRARLTAVLEGPGSPIESMLAVEAPLLGQATDQATGQATGNGTSGSNGARGEAGPGRIDSPQENKSTLADRIRSLQSSASRVASSN